MPDVDSVIRSVETAVERAKALRAWAAVSFSRLMLITTLLCAAAVLVLAATTRYLLYVTDKEQKVRMQQAHTLVEENSYKAALDSITLCLESEKGKSKISKWYCDDAINQYRNISRRQPQQRVIEIINLRAFGAMKNEVNHYLRIKSVDRLLFSPPTRNEEYLQLVLERTSIGFWVLISITFVSIIISFFTLFPPQNKTVN